MSILCKTSIYINHGMILYGMIYKGGEFINHASNKVRFKNHVSDKVHGVLFSE